MQQCALFLTGAVVGCVRPHRPWRWAVACFAVLALRDLVTLVNTAGMQQPDMPGLLLVVANHVGAYCLFALPVLLGALLGTSMMSAGLDE